MAETPTDLIGMARLTALPHIEFSRIKGQSITVSEAVPHGIVDLKPLNRGNEETLTALKDGKPAMNFVANCDGGYILLKSLATGDPSEVMDVEADDLWEMTGLEHRAWHAGSKGAAACDGLRILRIQPEKVE